MRDQVRSHLFMDAVVAAFVEEVEILVGQELRRFDRGDHGAGVGGHCYAERDSNLVYRKMPYRIVNVHEDGYYVHTMIS